MSITRVGTATASATTVVMPTPAIGDLCIIYAFRSTSAPPSLPSGWISILTETGTNSSCRVGYKIATSTSTASGTWTNALELICHVYRASSGNTLGIGATSKSASATNTLNYPALSMGDPNSGNSWVVGFAGVNNTTNTVNTAPSGMTNQSAITGAASRAAGQDTNGGVSSWSSTNATTTGTPGNSIVAVVEVLLLPMATVPSQVVQWVDYGTSPNTGNTGYSGNTWKLPIPNSLGSGNCLVLFFTCDNALTVSTMSDTVNGAWTSVSSITSAGNQDCHCYKFENSGSGASTITVTLSGVSLSFDAKFAELQGIATSSSGAGTSGGSAAQAGPALTAGSFTPTNNNATGGNLILAYFSKSVANGGMAHKPSQIVAGNNFTLMAANQADNAVAFNSATALEAFVQTTSAAINPGLSVVGDTDTFNSLAIALKLSSGSGTPPSATIHPETFVQMTVSAWPTSGTYSFQMVAQGATRVMMSDDPSLNALTVTDSEGNTYSGSVAANGIFYLLNASANANLTIFITGGGGDAKLSWRFIDSTNAATFDSVAGPVTDTIAISQTTLTPTVKANPSNTNGMVIYNIGLGTGPGLAATAPAGIVWLMPTYTGETDQDWLGNADICAWYHNTASGSITATFTITSQTVAFNDSGGMISFKAAITQNPFIAPDLPNFLPRVRNQAAIELLPNPTNTTLQTIQDILMGQVWI